MNARAAFAFAAPIGKRQGLFDGRSIGKGPCSDRADVKDGDKDKKPKSKTKPNDPKETAPKDGDAETDNDSMAKSRDGAAKQ
jgi:hypothetical protein